MKEQVSNTPPNEEGKPEKPKGWDYVIILIVFALTGTTAAVVPRYLMPYTGLEKGFLYYLIYFIVITPIYIVLLRIYSFLFGKAAYFRVVEKRIFGGFTKWFRKSN
ncbi:MAG: DUF6787 family protein [Bacteroidota bacterium]